MSGSDGVFAQLRRLQVGSWALESVRPSADLAVALVEEALALEVDRSITADHTVAVLEAIVASAGRIPEDLRMDNGDRTHHQRP